MTDRMTVKELKELLEKFDDNEIVTLASHENDAWVTIGDTEIMTD